MNPRQIINLLQIANNDLQSVKQRYKKLQRNVDHLESRELDASITLEDLKIQKYKADARFLPLTLSERAKKAQTKHDTKCHSKRV